MASSKKSRSVNSVSESKANESNESLMKEIQKRLRSFHPRNKKQSELWEAIDDYSLICGVGSAGTGKSMVSLAKALDLISTPDSKIKKIILLTPIVEAGDEKLGYLPGDMNDKIGPYHYSMYSIMYDLIGEDLTLKLVERKIIEPLIISFIRGYTAKNSIVIVDETQNITISGGKLILTRIGENSKIVFNGDDEQIDMKDKSKSALVDFTNRFKNFPKMKFVKFSKEDIVRNEIITEILSYYE